VGDRLHDRLHPLRRLGNPLASEAAAFRWLVAVAAVVLGIAALVVLARSIL
jgi:hypothetical protein